MPIYVYQCPICDEVIQKLRRMSDIDTPIFCPTHPAERCTRKAAVFDFAFKKGWIPTNEGWKRGDM